MNVSRANQALTATGELMNVSRVKQAKLATREPLNVRRANQALTPRTTNPDVLIATQANLAEPLQQPHVRDVWPGPIRH